MEKRLINPAPRSDRLALFKARNPHLSDIQRVPAIDGRAADREWLRVSGIMSPDLSYPDGAPRGPRRSFDRAFLSTSPHLLGKPMVGELARAPSAGSSRSTERRTPRSARLERMRNSWVPNAA
ncbi:hypothetical protein D9599_18280 [Roseomonas sp. KE2513]|uniref:hypothetical protein n=1 Tax=Roseomonas sp. KE2513 TaxID=2479202 RepID=UPI0018DFC0B8|nr:hypothetical protein [Roseomonas sp. KE2513]MBI0537510.1 hypothetical protein [Roseomonas sp. KE2513]